MELDSGQTEQCATMTQYKVCLIYLYRGLKIFYILLYFYILYFVYTNDTIFCTFLLIL